MAAPLEFTVTWEAWYAEAVRTHADGPDDPARSINVQCLADGKASSYVDFEELRVGTRPTVRMHLWADGWRILADHPSLFARLAARLTESCRLEDVAALLAEYGARDVTPRRHDCGIAHSPKD